MFFRRPSAPTPRRISGPDALRAAVREHLPEADDDTLRIVVAIAGAIASVAHADREYSPEEQAHTRQALASVHGLSTAGVDAICAVLAEHVIEIAAINPQAYTRDLRELGDVTLRREVLDLLVDVAAADGELALAETDLLRRTTSQLGLHADDYAHAQTRHRDKLKLLR